MPKLRLLSVAVASLLLASGVTAPAHADPTIEPVADVTVSDTVTGLDEELDSEPVVLDAPDAEGVVVPSDGEDGLTVPTIDGDTDPVTIGLPVEGEGESADGGAVAYAGENDSVGVVVQVEDTTDIPDISSAVRTLITIADENAPSRYDFPVDVPAGGRLELIEGSAVVLDEAGNTLGAIAAPWAVDGDARDIPTYFSIEGSTLVQHILHREVDTTYPVIADPVWFVPVLLVGGRVAVQLFIKASTQSAARSAAMRAAVEQTGKQATRIVGNITRATMRSFTQSNARYNLAVRTGKNPRGCQAHHTMPVKFLRDFTKAGININDPKYLLWWISTPGLANNHGSKAAKYNRGWEGFFKDNPNPTRNQILIHRSAMVVSYTAYYRC